MLLLMPNIFVDFCQMCYWNDIIPYLPSLLAVTTDAQVSLTLSPFLLVNDYSSSSSTGWLLMVADCLPMLQNGKVLIMKIFTFPTGPFFGYQRGVIIDLLVYRPCFLVLSIGCLGSQLDLIVGVKAPARNSDAQT